MSAYAMFPASQSLPKLKKITKPYTSTPPLEQCLATSTRSNSFVHKNETSNFLVFAGESNIQQPSISSKTQRVNKEKDCTFEEPKSFTEIAENVDNEFRRPTNDEICEPENDLSISVKSASLDRKKFIAASSTSPSVKKAGGIDQWEAVQYELTIDLHGKKYTAKRSFPSIVRLRKELIKELRTRKNNYPGRFGVIRSFMTQPTGSDEGTVVTADMESEDSLIPELPPDLCSDDGADVGSSVGLAGRTLNMIQSTASGNCPRIEEWLKVVSKLVNPNTSPSLLSFLAEPLEPEECMPRLFPRARRFLRRRSNRHSHSSLSSISEEISYH